MGHAAGTPSLDLKASMRSLVLGTTLLVLLAGTAEAGLCARDKRVLSACHEAHGRLRINANSRLYLWPFGTKRLLAVSYRSDLPEADPALPDNLAKLLGLDVDVVGDFLVCPMSEEKPGRMQIICIDSAERLTTRPKR